MSLITILFCLAIERFFGNLDHLRQFSWFDGYRNFVYQKLERYAFRDGPIGVLVIISGIAIPIVVLFYYALKDVDIVSISALVMAIVMVLYCLGPKDPARQVNRYLAALNESDSEAAGLYAGKFLNTELLDNPADIALQVKKAIFIELNDRIIGVLFWFIILGPLGAALFRMACILRDKEKTIDTGFAKACHDFYRIMTWPSARVCVLGFAVAGSFIGALRHLTELSMLWKYHSNDMLVKSAFGAMHDDSFDKKYSDNDSADLESVTEALSLAQRSSVALLAILAVLTIVGWLA